MKQESFFMCLRYLECFTTQREGTEGGELRKGIREMRWKLGVCLSVWDAQDGEKGKDARVEMMLRFRWRRHSAANIFRIHL
jgi:hypothetical protein